MLGGDFLAGSEVRRRLKKVGALLLDRESKDMQASVKDRLRKG